jgi:glycosyltransferase involved in cell wall biosynthesis
MIISSTGTHTGQKTPAVSIVIPAYNAARYVREALDSILAQTFTEYEVIVVNDGSADGDELERILASHPVPVVYLRQENKGVSAARNAGIKIARGEFYAQLDADDQWEPDYLRVQVGLLSEDPSVALVYPNAMIIGDASESGLEYMKICPSEGAVTFSSLIRQECTVMTCVTARMSAILDAGMFDEGLRSCEDFDLWLRIVKNGGRIIYHRQVLARYRRHWGSLSSDRVWMTASLLTVLDKAARTFDLTVQESEVLEQAVARYRAMLWLFEGKRALSRGEGAAALGRFEEANEYLRSRKLALVIFLLRHSPRLLILMFLARERYLEKRQRHLLYGIDKPTEGAS